MSGLSTAGATGPVFLDGDLVEWDKANLHVASFGLHNASCVFEGIRAYGGQPFALNAHCRRLCESAQMLGLDLPYSQAGIEQAVLDVLTASGHADAYVRPVVWHGSELLGINPHGASVHLAILVVPWHSAAAGATTGVRLGLSRWARPASHTAPVTAKASCNYVVSALAQREAIAAGFDDALLLDYRGYLAEATGANVFLVHRDRLVTPIADTFLDGITRRTVLALARDLGIGATEKRVHPDELASATEVFLTGTACEILSVRSVDDSELPEAHPITSALVAAYRSATGQEQEVTCG